MPACVCGGVVFRSNLSLKSSSDSSISATVGVNLVSLGTGRGVPGWVRFVSAALAPPHGDTARSSDSLEILRSQGVLHLVSQRLFAASFVHTECTAKRFLLGR